MPDFLSLKIQDITGDIHELKESNQNRNQSRNSNVSVEELMNFRKVFSISFSIYFFFF
jgi:hypothetical protein